MKIELNEISVRELVEDYIDDGEGGVTGYGGRLDIRPPYQREFVYKDSQRDAVINSIQEHCPLNIMYWAVRSDGSYEVIDGQQRTISIAQYVSGDFSFGDLFFENLPGDRKKQILDYKLMVYVCDGSDSERLKWFETINIAGEKLTPQELRNAVYAGSWVSDAKRYFSRNGCPAYGVGRDYMNGSPIRQEYLEMAIKWHKDSGKTIEEYMGKHQHDPTAVALWNYFRSVIDWVEATFTKKRPKMMRGVDWGSLYNDHKHRRDLDPSTIEEETAKLVKDRDVTNQKGIYPYLLTRNEKYLNIRTFDDGMKQWAYEKQNGICVSCKEQFDLSEMEADHITPWCEGGPTKEENCQMLCKGCNRRKSSK